MKLSWTAIAMMMLCVSLAFAAESTLLDDVDTLSEEDAAVLSQAEDSMAEEEELPEEVSDSEQLPELPEELKDEEGDESLNPNVRATAACRVHHLIDPKKISEMPKCEKPCWGVMPRCTPRFCGTAACEGCDTLCAKYEKLRKLENVSAIVLHHRMIHQHWMQTNCYWRKQPLALWYCMPRDTVAHWAQSSNNECKPSPQLDMAKVEALPPCARPCNGVEPKCTYDKCGTAQCDGCEDFCGAAEQQRLNTKHWFYKKSDNEVRMHANQNVQVGPTFHIPGKPSPPPTFTFDGHPVYQRIRTKEEFANAGRGYHFLWCQKGLYKDMRFSCDKLPSGFFSFWRGICDSNKSLLDAEDLADEDSAEEEDTTDFGLDSDLSDDEEEEDKEHESTAEEQDQDQDQDQEKQAFDENQVPEEPLEELEGTQDESSEDVSDANLNNAAWRATAPCKLHGNLDTLKIADMPACHKPCFHIAPRCLPQFCGTAACNGCDTVCAEYKKKAAEQKVNLGTFGKRYQQALYRQFMCHWRKVRTSQPSYCVPYEVQRAWSWSNYNDCSPNRFMSSTKLSKLPLCVRPCNGSLPRCLPNQCGSPECNGCKSLCAAYEGYRERQVVLSNGHPLPANVQVQRMMMFKDGKIVDATIYKDAHGNTLSTRQPNMSELHNLLVSEWMSKFRCDLYNGRRPCVKKDSAWDKVLEEHTSIEKQ